MVLMLSENVFAGVNLKDINNHWAKDNIIQLIEKDIINGYPDRTFKPENHIEQDAFIKLIITTLGYKVDNHPDYWAKNYIDKGCEIGIIKNGEIKKGSYITREHMANIIAKSLKLKKDIEVDNSRLKAFFEEVKDVKDINSDYAKNVFITYQEGIITGYPDGRFLPNGILTRAEATTVIIRLYNKLNGNGEEPTQEPEESQELSIEDIKNDPELSKRVNFDKLDFHENGTVTVSSGYGSHTMTKEQTAIIKGIIEKATPILPEGEKLAIRYVDSGGDYQRVSVELRCSEFTIHYLIAFMVNSEWKHYIDTITDNPKFILEVSSFDYNDILDKYKYPVKTTHDGRIIEYDMDSRYINVYKIFLNALFNESSNQMFDYTLNKYLDYDEVDYFYESDYNFEPKSKTDNYLGYRIDRTWTSSGGNEFYFSAGDEK